MCVNTSPTRSRQKVGTEMSSLTTTFLVFVLLETVSSVLAATKPNVIFVVADDLGWNDVSWHNPGMITPNLERYAREGVILNSSYVQYYCSPSRNSFMTGYFPYHTGLQHGVIMAGQPRHVPLNFTMLPQLLKKAGYSTHIVGKWHLGMCNWNYTPTYRGFDSFFGYYNGQEDYYTHTVQGGYDLRLNTSIFKDPSHEHFTYLLTQHATDVIRNHDPASPLFLYLPFHLVHAPLQVPERFKELYTIHNQNRQTYCGMVSMMDEAFGNITRSLEQAGLMNNTLVIFTTDNGGPIANSANNWPLRGGKTTFWEGGTRGTAFVWSKNLLNKSGYTSSELMHAVDWFPTILHLAGVKPDSPIDGVNQWEMLSNGAPSNRTEFVYNIDTILNSTAIRYGDYKLLTGSPGNMNDWYPPPEIAQSIVGRRQAPVASHDWKPQLYNIRIDPEERVDLADSDPERLQFMLARLQHWMESGVHPQNSGVVTRANPSHWDGVWTPGWC